MRTSVWLSAWFVLLVGCRQEVTEVPEDWVHASTLGELGCTLPRDMGDMTAPPACPAAKGLPGTNLLCVDFAKVNQLSELNGWDFDKFDKNCWEIAGGKLQVKNFKDFMSSCGFLMPGVSPSDYQKYNRFTLSVIQTLDVNKMQQTALIYLGLDTDARQIASHTGVNPRQRNIYEIDKAALPNSGTNTYQPLFKLVSNISVGNSSQGWQIESIAINAIE